MARKCTHFEHKNRAHIGRTNNAPGMELAVRDTEDSVGFDLKDFAGQSEHLRFCGGRNGFDAIR